MTTSAHDLSSKSYCCASRTIVAGSVSAQADPAVDASARNSPISSPASCAIGVDDSSNGFSTAPNLFGVSLCWGLKYSALVSPPAESRSSCTTSSSSPSASTAACSYHALMRACTAADTSSCIVSSTLPTCRPIPIFVATSGGGLSAEDALYSPLRHTSVGGART